MCSYEHYTSIISETSARGCKSAADCSHHAKNNPQNGLVVAMCAQAQKQRNGGLVGAWKCRITLLRAPRPHPLSNKAYIQVRGTLPGACRASKHTTCGTQLPAWHANRQVQCMTWLYSLMSFQQQRHTQRLQFLSRPRCLRASL